MKFLHTADWHIGKELGAFSLLSEQWQAFRQMVTIAEDEAVDGIIIAGDLYDRGIPPLSAVEAFEDMARIMNLEHHWPIYAVSGNHDGAVRLGAGREWRETTSFYLHTTLAEAFEPVELADTQIFMLPFLDPLDARIYYQMSDEESRDYTSIEAVMARIIPDLVAKFKPGKHHILVT
ncbi:metallophosphoesterase family protein, partial [Weissella soli]